MEKEIMRDIKIDSGKNLKKFLTKIVKESVSFAKTNLQEKDDIFADEPLTPNTKKEPVQQQPKQQVPPQPKGVAPSANQNALKDKPIQQQKLEEPKQQQKPNVNQGILNLYPQNPQAVDVQMIMDKINAMRAGRGTDTVQAELENYINKLKDEEKKVLASFLSSLGAIMSGQISGSEIPEPEESLNVEIMSDKEIEDFTQPRRKVVVRDEQVIPAQDDFVPIKAKPRY